MLELLKERYIIIRKIGQGGMAEIYLAKDKTTGKEVALKILHPDNKKNEVHKKRFLSEIKLTQKVNSPYVVKVIDYKWNQDLQYIAMEYINGEILKDYIVRRTRINVDEVVEFAKQLALGFEEIHRAGIVHRDIKSQNIMISDHGEIKIIDFGIAITNESDRLTRTDNIIGSVQYIAPEILEQRPITPLSDIYALGVLVYEMLTGEVPFKERSVFETAMKHKNSIVPHVNKSFDNIPQSLANVVIKATAKDTNKRYKSMYAFYKDVANCLSKDRMYEEVYSLEGKHKKNFTEMINSKWVLIGIVGFLLVVLLVAIIFIVMMQGS